MADGRFGAVTVVVVIVVVVVFSSAVGAGEQPRAHLGGGSAAWLDNEGRCYDEWRQPAVLQCTSIGEGTVRRLRSERAVHDTRMLGRRKSNHPPFCLLV
jgi:hypothetical protein